MTNPSWQKVFSTLATPKLREIYAAAVLGQEVAATEKELAKLVAAGLVIVRDGRPDVNQDLFKDVLGAAAPERPKGVGRFFEEGWIQGIPRKPEDRNLLLAHLASRLFPVDEELRESEANRLLATVTTDVPTLRRALVDFGFLERNQDGTGYRLVR